MVTNNILALIFLCGITFAIQNLKSGTFDHEKADFLIPHTDVKVLLNLREIACLTKCLSVDICQAAAVAKMTEDREYQACGLLLYQEGSNATVRKSISLDLQYRHGISAIWIKSSVTGRTTAEGICLIITNISQYKSNILITPVLFFVCLCDETFLICSIFCIVILLLGRAPNVSLCTWQQRRRFLLLSA